MLQYFSFHFQLQKVTKTRNVQLIILQVLTIHSSPRRAQSLPSLFLPQSYKLHLPCAKNPPALCYLIRLHSQLTGYTQSEPFLPCKGASICIRTWKASRIFRRRMEQFFHCFPRSFVARAFFYSLFSQNYSCFRAHARTYYHASVEAAGASASARRKSADLRCVIPSGCSFDNKKM